MTKTDIVTLVKEIFARSTAQKFAEATLDNGAVVMTPGEFEVGADLFVVGEDENVPAPDGEHKLEDGTVVKSEGGKIIEIVPVVVDQVVEEELEEKKEDEKVEELEVEEEDKEEEDKLKLLSESLEEAIAKIAVLEEKVARAEEASMMIAEEFSKMPGGDKITFKKTGFSEQTKSSNDREGKLNDLFEFVKSVKSVKK